MPKTTGIYKITNLMTGRFYIGQSKNIERRYIEHCTRSHDKEIVDLNINLWGKENFSLEILEECPIDKLDEREDYYIKLYNAVELGYNILNGGQNNGYRCGENNGNAKLTDEDVYNIRESYRKREKRGEVFSKYSDKISESSFNSIWQGQYWKSVHMDVYTDEALEYYIGRTFTDEEVYMYRKEYVNKSIKEIYNDHNETRPFSTFSKMILGQHYKHIPIYNKKKKIWIEN